VSVVHLPQHTSLTGYRDAIVREVDGVALRVGKLLRDARMEHPARFDRWVVNELPFGLETARRLMAISAAYEKLPPETLRSLPRPWQAMYALKQLPPAVLQRAVEAGDIHPDMTVEAAKHYARAVRSKSYKVYKRANTTAGRLMRCQPSDLSSSVLDDLREWVFRDC
jgi:hypothetical protein